MSIWHLATAFDALAASIFAVLWDATAKGTVLLALAGAVAMLMYGKSAAVRHTIWVSTLVCMVALPVLSSVLPSAAVLPVWLDLTRLDLGGASDRAADRRPAPTADLALLAAPTARNAPLDDPGARRETARISTVPPIAEAPPPVSRETPSRTATARNHDPISPLARVSALAWLIGCLLCLARLALSAAYLRRLGRHNQVVQNGALFAELEASKLTLGCTRPVRLLVRSGSTLPLAWGLVRPTVLLPAEARDWPPAQRRAVLLHELAHIMRGDPLWRMLAELARAVYWFHPLVWLAARRAHVESEGATDDLVLHHGVGAAGYARILLDVVSRVRVRRLGLALGVAMASTRTLESRLRSIMDPTKDRRAMTRKAVSIAVATCLLIAAPLATLRTADAQVDPASKNASAERQKEPSGAAPPAADEAASQAEQDTTRRVRELIYIFRHMRVFDRVDEWASAIRELVQIGEPAVPELVAELDRTNRDQTLRALGFTLRAIHDPRAVPALIHAIPKTAAPSGSDYGLGVSDPELMKFMLEHDRNRGAESSYFSFGRPVNEIPDALATITGHQEPEPPKDRTLQRQFPAGTAEKRAVNRTLKQAEFRKRQEHWNAWWAEHWQEFVTRAELDSVAPHTDEHDWVEQAGVARFGPLFPTGESVQLGPIHEATLSTRQLADVDRYLDLDTHQTFVLLEGTNLRHGVPAGGNPQSRWYHDRGVDLVGEFHSGLDLHLWLIDNNRWDTLENEIRSGAPIAPGREATNSLVPFDKEATDFQKDHVGTFLFTTREGGRGIIQQLPSDDPSIMRVRYRLWEDPTRPREPAPQAADEPRERGQREPTVTATLATPGRGKAFLLNLESGKPFAPPDSQIPADADGSFSFHEHPRLPPNPFAAWCRQNGVDIAAVQTTVAHEASLNTNTPSRAPDRLVALAGLDMDAFRVSSEAFDTMSATDAVEIVNRYPPQYRSAHMSQEPWYLPDPLATFIISTKAGRVGLLQIVKTADDRSSVTLRYRLVKPSADARGDGSR